MRLRTLTLIPLAAAAGVLGTAAPASADTLLAQAPGAKNLTYGGGYVAWAAPADGGRWKLTVRRADGTVFQPAIADFGAPPDPSIGSDRFGFAGRRTLLAYSRCEGASTVRGCDVYAYNLASGEEERVAGLATRAYSETAPSVQFGRWAFVRRGGARNGIYTMANGRLRRLTSTVAHETATTASRVAYSFTRGGRGGVAIRRLSGEGPTLVPVKNLSGVPTSIGLTRYQAVWLAPVAGGGVKAQRTDRFAGSGGPYTLRVRDASRELPAGTTSLAIGSSTRNALAIDVEGVKRLSPPLFR